MIQERHLVFSSRKVDVFDSSLATVLTQMFFFSLAIAIPRNQRVRQWIVAADQHDCVLVEWVYCQPKY